MSKRKILWTMFCPLLYIMILWKLVPIVYGIVDDRSMMEILSGQYLKVPNSHSIFLGYWYSLFVSRLYGLNPNVDWYALSYLSLQGICMGLALHRLLEKRKTWVLRGRQAAFVILWSIILGIQAVTQITFTTTAAILGVTVIFWYMTMQEYKKTDLVVLFLLCFFTAECRFSVYCMIIPVCGVLWLFRAFDDREQWKKHLYVPLIAIGAMGFCVIGLNMGYGSKEWRTYDAYNNTRSMIYDYNDYMFPRYEDETDLYNRVGVESKSRAKNLFYYNYTADDKIDEDFFKVYLSERKAQVKADYSILSRLKISAKIYVKNALSGKYEYRHLAALLGYAILFIWYISGKNWKNLLRAVSIMGVQLILWLYLIYRGRMPERVLISMNLMLIVPLILMWLEEADKIMLPIAWKKTGWCIFAAGLFLLSANCVKTVRAENLRTYEDNKRIERLKEYCMEHPENFYFNDVTSLAMSTYNVRLW